MASKRQRGDAWEYTFKRAGVLDKPLYLTFKSEAEGDEYARKLDALLERGVVPTEYQARPTVTTVAELVTAYTRDAPVKHKDQRVLNTVVKMTGATTLAGINANWVDGWVSDMKRVHKLNPSTIRAKVGALARCCDWGMRRGLVLMPDHPLRTLPDGYAQYTDTDVALAGVRKTEKERDRRLEAGEWERIGRVLDGGVLERKQRPFRIEHVEALRVLMTLAVESAMRLRELYTLDVAQVNVAQRTVFLDKTKNGDRRQVPLSSVAVSAVKDYLTAHATSGLLFPWWDGDTSARALSKTSDYLSKLAVGVFEQAGCTGLTFHCLRHEAISRFFERTALSETEIMKAVGHRTHRMTMRYAQLRGSAMAEKMW